MQPVPSVEAIKALVRRTESDGGLLDFAGALAECKRDQRRTLLAKKAIADRHERIVARLRKRKWPAADLARLESESDRLRREYKTKLSSDEAMIQCAATPAALIHIEFLLSKTRDRRASKALKALSVVASTGYSVDLLSFFASIWTDTSTSTSTTQPLS